MARSTEILLLEATPRAAVLVAVRRCGPSLHIRRVVLVDAPSRGGDGPAPDSDRLAIAFEPVVDELAAAVAENGWRRRAVTVVVGGGSTTCQYVQVPPMKAAARRSAIRLKVAQQLPYPVDEAVLWVESPTQSRSRVPRGAAGETAEPPLAAVALRREEMLVLLRACERIGLEPVQVTAWPLALAHYGRVAESAPAAQGLHGLLYMNETSSLLVIYRNGRTVATAELTVRLADFATALRRPIISGDEVIQLDEEAARRLRDEAGIPLRDATIASLNVPAERVLPLLEPTCQQLTRQLTQWASFLRGTYPGETLGSLRIAGPAARMPNLDAALAERLGIEVGPLTWPPAILEGVDPAATGATFEALVGAALAPRSALPDLRPAEVVRSRYVERARRASVMLAPVAAAVLITATALIQNVSGGLSAVRAEQMATLNRTRAELARWDAWRRTATAARDLEDELKAFARATPQWEGFLKELAQVLPRSARTTSLVARSTPAGLVARLTVDLYEFRDVDPFDRQVEGMLNQLQVSPFVEQVDVLSAVRSVETDETASSNNRRPAGDFGAATTLRPAGSVTVDLKLAYPRPPQKTNAGNPHPGRNAVSRAGDVRGFTRTELVLADRSARRGGRP